ncbi:MAG TPA: hypothetical protein VLG68_04995 [Gammaproteobacteria bacterium]|nr:hypothetical protein [Gammaproteobacteria bacterium]
MNRPCAILVTLAGLCLASAARADADGYSISADQWAQPRSGAELVRLPPLRAAVQDWIAHPGSRIVIVDSGSDTGSLWAGEVADWLVALGVPSDQIGKRVSAEQGEDSLLLLVER